MVHGHRDAMHGLSSGRGVLQDGVGASGKDLDGSNNFVFELTFGG